MHSGTFLKTFAAAALATTTLATAGVGAASAADNSAPTVAPAWNLLFGIGVTSDYIARGYRQSTGAAVQPWAELDIGPVYLGYWGSNVSPSLLGGAHWESDLSIGVRGAHGPISWDGGYVRYVYDNSSIDYGEIYGKFTINPIMPLTLGASIFYNPDSSESNARVYVEGNAKVMLTDMIYVSGAVGNQSYYSGSSDFSWNAGVAWMPHPWLTFDGRYWGGPDSNKFTVSMSIATDLNSIKSGNGPKLY